MQRVSLSEKVLDKLNDIAGQSFEDAIRVGRLLKKAENFEDVGLRDCNAKSELRYLGQHLVLPVKCDSLFAFVEICNSRQSGRIFHVTQVTSFSDIREAWEKVHEHFGYSSEKSRFSFLI